MVRKKAAKKKAVAKRSSTAIANVQERMRQIAENQNVAEGGEGNFISTNNSEFTYRGTDMGTELSVIILAFAHDYTYYDRKYDPDNPTPPACFAVDDVKPRDLVCHSDSPVPQSDDCDSCELNQFGSDGGKGKVCRNHYRLAVIPSDSDYSDAEIAYIRVAPSGYSKFSSYVRTLRNKHDIPVLGCVTNLSFMEDVDYPSVVCNLEEIIEDEDQLQILLSRFDEAAKGVCEHDYAVDQYEPLKKKVSKKKVTTKRR